jgi:membrane carboxypeptidase/penicillin-binding protein
MRNVHGISVTGGSLPAEIWGAFMYDVDRQYPEKDFAEPKVPVSYDGSFSSQYRVVPTSSTTTSDTTSDTTSETTDVMPSDSVPSAGTTTTSEASATTSTTAPSATEPPTTEPSTDDSTGT